MLAGLPGYMAMPAMEGHGMGHRSYGLQEGCCHMATCYMANMLWIYMLQYIYIFTSRHYLRHCFVTLMPRLIYKKHCFGWGSLANVNRMLAPYVIIEPTLIRYFVCHWH